MPRGDHDLVVPHATTCLALRFADGVIMAGDRRATSGNLISHRGMEKVVQADRFSGVAIAGSAGPAMEMIKLFQLQLEHYEKVEGSALSLEGKANQLSMMVRGNLPAAMQGSSSCRSSPATTCAGRTGRLWTYDVTGGRYEEQDYVATGSGSCTPARSSRSASARTCARDDGIALACKALWEAADADSATGMPDPLRGIYPVIATITSSGWARVGDDELARVFESIAAEVRAR